MFCFINQPDQKAANDFGIIISFSVVKNSYMLQFAYHLTNRSSPLDTIERASNLAIILGALDDSIEDKIGQWLHTNQSELIQSITGFYNFKDGSNLTSLGSESTSAGIDSNSQAKQKALEEEASFYSIEETNNVQSLPKRPQVVTGILVCLIL
jgi:hypothetical protein